MTDDSHSAPLREQLEYYCARAGEYDQWWLRQGRYDHGPEINSLWFNEGREVEDALSCFRPTGHILELACGTGIWTKELLPFATELTAVDGATEMLAINAARLNDPRVRYIEADLFDWQPTEQFDTVFFAFWLSHLPHEQFDSFWDLVRRCLAPQGRVFFVDSRHEPTSTAINHVLPDGEAITLRRRLNDGREFQIFKVLYEPSDLATRLARLGWRFDIEQTERYFLYGSGTRSC